MLSFYDHSTGLYRCAALRATSRNDNFVINVCRVLPGVVSDNWVLAPSMRLAKTLSAGGVAAFP